MNGRNPAKNEVLKRELRNPAAPQPGAPKTMYPMTVTIKNEVELAAVMAAFGGKTPASTPAVKSEPAAKADKSPKEEKKTEPKAIDYEKDVKPAALALVAKKGRDAWLAILAGYDAKLGTDLKAEEYAAVLEKITAAMA